VENYREQLIDGEFVTGGGAEFTSIDPYSEEPWAVFTEADEADVDRAVESAKRAFDDWRKTPGIERARLMNALADAVERDLDRLSEIETRDNGKLLRENRNQIGFAVRNFRFFAGMADKITGDVKSMDSYTTFDFTTRDPIGVCVLITAWNSPLQLLSNKLPPALAAGNTVVIKPSEYTTASTLELARLAIEVGFPKGVINVVSGAGTTGALLTAHPGINKISFTGGIETAKRIAATAATNIVPCSLELGGKSANILFEDAPYEKALAGAIGGIFAASGQSCVAGSRLLVQESLYERVIADVAERAARIVLGSPLDPTTQMGPIAFRAHYEKVLGHIADAIADGSRLVTGGHPSKLGGLFVEPTVFADVDNASRLAQNEVFGPVLAIMPFTDEADAIRLANDSRFGLAGGVWSQDVTRAFSVAKEIRAGIMYINTYRSSAAQAPSGGFKQSGYGRERGAEALHDYTVVKNTMVDLTDTVRDPFVLGR
jgi:aldehyde dehydrogenase (NAD+)